MDDWTSGDGDRATGDVVSCVAAKGPLSLQVVGQRFPPFSCLRGAESEIGSYAGSESCACDVACMEEGMRMYIGRYVGMPSLERCHLAPSRSQNRDYVFPDYRYMH